VFQVPGSGAAQNMPAPCGGTSRSTEKNKPYHEQRWQNHASQHKHAHPFKQTERNKPAQNHPQKDQ
jgi:hypothetical protein